MKKIMILLLPLVLFWGGCDRNSRIIGYWASDVNLTIKSLKKLMADSSDIFEKERYRMYIESLEKGEGLEHMPLALQSKFIIKIEGNGKMIFFMNDSKKVGSYSTKSSSKIIGNLGGRFSMTLDGEALRMIPLGQLDLETGFPIIFSRTSPPVSEVQPEEPHAKTKPLEPVTVSPNLKYEIKGDEVTITGCDKKALGALIIPVTIEGKPVTSIGISAFEKCTNLTSITIPDSVTSIRRYAFARCSSLKSITVPDSVTSIDNWTFRDCTNLMSVTIGNSVTSIGEAAFYKCSSLTSVTIPNSVTSIYRNPETKGWGDTWGGRPVELITEKP